MPQCDKCKKEFLHLHIIGWPFKNNKETHLCKPCKQEWRDLWKEPYHTRDGIIVHSLPCSNPLPEKLWNLFMENKVKIIVQFT